MKAFKEVQNRKAQEVMITKQVHLEKREEDKNIFLRNRAQLDVPMPPPPPKKP